MELVNEADINLARAGIHKKLAHEYWIGPWRVAAIEQPGFSYHAALRGRWIRGRALSATIMKMFYVGPERLRHAFEDECAHLAGRGFGVLREPRQ